MTCLPEHFEKYLGDIEGPLLDGSPMEALYVTHPVYQPDEFAVCREPDRAIEIAWLVPVSAAEADHIRKHGWEKFETLLVDQNPNLMDLSRPSLL